MMRKGVFLAIVGLLLLLAPASADQASDTTPPNSDSTSSKIEASQASPIIDLTVPEPTAPEDGVDEEFSEKSADGLDHPQQTEGDDGPGMNAYMSDEELERVTSASSPEDGGYVSSDGIASLYDGHSDAGGNLDMDETNDVYEEEEHTSTDGADVPLDTAPDPLADGGGGDDSEVRALLDEAAKLRFDDLGRMVTEMPAKVFELYETAAAMGNAEALHELGEIYLFGYSGTETDFKKALGYFNRACDMGYPHAQHNRGFMYSLGLGVERDEAKAVLNWYFAAVGGSLNARMVLGYRHLYGYSVPKSCSVAAKYYTQVAETVVASITDETSPTLAIEKARLADEESRLQAPDEDEDVIQYFEHSANSGEAEAQYALGQLYLFGARGVPQDNARAARYFQAASSQGHAASTANLGQMYMQGLGVRQDNDTAFKYFKEAADKGNAVGQTGLGNMYMHGRGVKKNLKKSMQYFKLAADQGNADAQFNLGVMFVAGLGTKKNYQSALQYFTLAGHHGHTQALFNLGQMHMNGLGTAPSCKTGIRFLKSVAERGEEALALSDAHRQYLAGNYESSLMMYARAGEEGHEIAQSNSAWLFEQAQHLLGSDMAKLALRHFKHAALQGNVDAERVIGDYFYYGVVGTPDYEQAVQHYMAASDKRNVQAMFNLGYMHQHGLGIPQDFHLSKRYYDQALEASPEAYVPVKLALLNLHLHKWWSSVGVHYAPAWLVDLMPAAHEHEVAPAEEPSSQTQHKPMGPDQSMLDDITRFVGQKVGGIPVTFEDLLLYSCCLALAYIIYQRAA